MNLPFFIPESHLAVDLASPLSKVPKQLGEGQGFRSRHSYLSTLTCLPVLEPKSKGKYQKKKKGEVRTKHGEVKDWDSDLGGFWAWVFSIALLAAQEPHLRVVRMRTRSQTKVSSP